VLLPTVPPVGALAPRIRDLLSAYTNQHGTEQHDGFLKAPVIVHSLCLKKPERLEALGRILWRARLLWRVMERAMRTDVDPTRRPWMGWAKNVTERPTACRMVTKCAGVIVCKCGAQRQRAQPLAVIQQQYLTALDGPAACCPGLTSG